jgi:hypothetical protein
MDALLLVLVFTGAYVVFMFLMFGLAKLFFPPVDEKDAAAKSKTIKTVKRGVMSRVNR